MIHLIFQEADRQVLQQAMELEPSLQGDIVEIKDEWGVGPLEGLETSEGREARLQWWKEKLAGSPYEKSLGSFDDYQTLMQLIERLQQEPEQDLWIWMAQNQHDVTGYYWLIPQLKPFQGRVYILFLNNLPFLNEKGQLFYPSFISEILPKEAVKARKLARPVTLAEFEVDPDEWLRLSRENNPVRILEGGKKIVGKDASFYDADLLRHASGEWQKASRLITSTLGKMKIKTGDVYLAWRVKELIASGKLEATGNLEGGWKEFDVRLPGKAVTAGAEEMNNEENK